MASYSGNEFKPGLKVILDGDPYVMLESEFFKPGKGQAFNRVKLRNLKTGRVLDRTCKAGDSFEAADVRETRLQYLYRDGELWHFMDTDNYEQIAVGAAALGDSAKWLKGEEICEVTLWNGEPLTVLAPTFVELRIAETDPGVRGDTVSGGAKTATLETGAVVKVPLFIERDEVIKVDTRSGEYAGRA